ncbi:unnamed protein product [Closterium sp. NIES-54]
MSGPAVKGEVPDILIPWICIVRLQLRERFRQDLPVLRLHSDRGGEFSFHLLREFCRGKASSSRSCFQPHRSKMELLSIAWLSHGGRLYLHDPCGCFPFSVAVCGSCSLSPGGVEPGGAEPKGVEPGGAEPRGITSSRGPADASTRMSPGPEPLSPQQLREWFAQRTRLRSGAAGAGDSDVGDNGAGGVGATRLGGAGVTAAAGGTGGAAAAGPGGARTRCTRAAGTGSVGGAGARGSGAGDPSESGGARAGGPGAGGAGAGGAGAGDTGDVGTGAGGTGAVLGLTFSPLLTPPLLCPPPYYSPPPLQPASPLAAPSPYTEKTTGLTECCEPETRPAWPVRAVRSGRHIPHPRPPPVPGTNAMALRPSSVPLLFPLSPFHESTLPAVPVPESDLTCAASPTVSRLLATVVTDASFDSTATSALVAELINFDAACRLDYASALVAESESGSLSSVGDNHRCRDGILEVHRFLR